MNPTLRPLVIDAQARGPRGLLAFDLLRGRTLLEHLVELATEVTRSSEIAIHAPVEDHEALSKSLDVRFHPRVRFVGEAAPDGSTKLRTDRLYSSSTLRKVLSRGRDPESAVIWRLDTENGRRGADDEYQRRLSYQPLGQYWAIKPARFLARWLAPTFVRPNMVTLASASLMIMAALVLGFGPAAFGSRFTTATLLAIALILDTTDGHLARLQGTTSEFGRWLDSWLDEVCDMVLHLAAAWSAFSVIGNVGWLVTGMVYAMGKSIFMVGVNEWKEPRAEEIERSGLEKRSYATDLIRTMGHADLRWHLWIVLALFGQLPIALAVYAIYYPTRALLGALSKGVRYA